MILPDRPEIAPESPGDLCDATEIDEILTLRIMTLTDEEKRQARGTDERAAQIIERSDSMAPDVLERLHGTIRERQNAASEGRLEVGSSVVLRPTRRADAMDMFLAGRTATVRSVEHDFDGRVHVAVTIDDDPGADLHDSYGRFFYFAPDEVELVHGSVG
jgi:hypothetical protein